MTDRKQRTIRTRHEPRDRYDVIVIGAGIGGLFAAARLANSGRRVLVVDRHYVPGGNATLFRRKGYVFDVGLHYIGDAHEGGFFPTALEDCGVRGLQFRQMDDDLEEVHFPDETFTIPRQLAVFEERLLERFPDEKKGITRYIRFLKQAERMQQADASGSKLKMVGGLVRSPLIAQYGMRTFGEFLDSCTKNERLRTIICAQSGTYAVAPSRVSSVLHAGLQNHYFRSGGWYPEGGGQELSDRLADAIEDQGGDVRLITEAREIIVENGRARGVRVFNKHFGERTISASAVISNADLAFTFNELVPAHAQTDKIKRYADYEMALPLFTVFLGVDLPPEELPWGNRNVWYYGSDDLEGEYAKLEAGELPTDPFLYISTASLKDPDNTELAPEGMSNLEVMTLAPRAGSAWGVPDDAPADHAYADSAVYQEKKALFEERILATFAKLYPEVHARIVFKESASPQTHRRYINSTGGGAYGFSALPSQFLHHRPGPSTEIEGLYICGASCRAGHGIVGAAMSGMQAARALIRR